MMVPPIDGPLAVRVAALGYIQRDVPVDRGRRARRQVHNASAHQLPGARGQDH